MNTKYFLLGCLILFTAQTTLSMQQPMNEISMDNQHKQNHEVIGDFQVPDALRSSPFSQSVYLAAVCVVSHPLIQWVKNGVQDYEATRTFVLKCIKILDSAAEEQAF